MPASGTRGLIGDSEFVWLDEGQDLPDPLVLIHGFTGHRDDFADIAKEFGKTRHVIAPDLRGHGDSVKQPGPEGWSFDQLVQDLVDLLDRLEIERCDLLGHSMGGMLTLRFALAYPERIRSLIFMCSAPVLSTTLSRPGFIVGAEIADARGMDGLQILMEKAGRENCSASIESWSERYWPHHRRRLCAMTPESFRGIGTAFFDSDSLVARLDEIGAPTLVLVGEFDVDFLPGADLFEKHLRNVHRVTLANAEHHPHQENPSAFYAALETHLARVAEGPNQT